MATSSSAQESPPESLAAFQAFLASTTALPPSADPHLASDSHDWLFDPLPLAPTKSIFDQQQQNPHQHINHNQQQQHQHQQLNNNNINNNDHPSPDSAFFSFNPFINFDQASLDSLSPNTSQRTDSNPSSPDPPFTSKSSSEPSDPFLSMKKQIKVESQDQNTHITMPTTTSSQMANYLTNSTPIGSGASQMLPTQPQQAQPQCQSQQLQTHSQQYQQYQQQQHGAFNPDTSASSVSSGTSPMSNVSNSTSPNSNSNSSSINNNNNSNSNNHTNNQLPSHKFSWKKDHTTPKMPISRLGGNQGRTPIQPKLPIVPKQTTNTNTSITSSSSTNSSPSNTTPPSTNTGPVPTGTNSNNKSSAEPVRKRKQRDDTPAARVPAGHNAVERRYRTNLNNSMASLRNLIPALQHLQPENTNSSIKKKNSTFGITDPSAKNYGLIDGIEPATKLSKGVILGKTIEYVNYLQRRRDELEAEVLIWRDTVISSIENGEQVSEAIEQKVAQAHAQIAANRTSLSSITNHPMDLGSSGASSKRMKKSDSDSDNMQDFEVDDDMDVSLTSPPNNNGANPAPPRTLLALFSGVSFIGGIGYELSRSSSSSSSSQQLWKLEDDAQTNLTKRDIEQTSFDPMVAINTGILCLGVFSILSLLLFFIWPVFSKVIPIYSSSSSSSPSSSFNKSQRNQKENTAKNILYLLDSIENTPGEFNTNDNLVEIHSRISSYIHSQNSLVGLVYQFVLFVFNSSYYKIFSPSAKFSPHEIQNAFILVRLAEIETVLASQISLISKLHTLLKLRNLVSRARVCKSSIPDQLELPRMRACLILFWCSIFKIKSSTFGLLADWARLSWDRITTSDNNKSNDSSTLHPWTQLSLDVDLNYALNSSAHPTAKPSPSNTTPLMRVAEYKCEEILVNIWQWMFKMTVSRSLVDVVDKRKHSSLSDQLANKISIEHDQRIGYGQQIDDVLDALPQTSPLRSFVLATKTFYVMLCLDKTRRSDPQSAMIVNLALETFGSIPEYDYVCCHNIGKLLGLNIQRKYPNDHFQQEATTNGHLRPAQTADMLADITARYALLLRSFALQRRQTDGDDDFMIRKELHTETLAIRRLLSLGSFTKNSVHDDQDAEDIYELQWAFDSCIEKLVGLGRKAAGIGKSTSGSLSDDSGCEVD